MQATFTTAGDTDPHPTVVYLRSNVLSRLIKRKHTVSLRNVGHENPENVLAVLTETHTRGRYAMSRGRTFQTHKHNFETFTLRTGTRFWRAPTDPLPLTEVLRVMTTRL